MTSPPAHCAKGEVMPRFGTAGKAVPYLLRMSCNQSPSFSDYMGENVLAETDTVPSSGSARKGEHMEDREIIDLFWQRDEQAIRETDEKYGSRCRSVSRDT